MSKLCENCNWFQQANNETYCNKLDEGGIENSDAGECEYGKNKQDGGDVVKKIYNIALAHRMVNPRYEYNKGFSAHTEWLIKFIEEQLLKNGIEVE